MSINEDSDHSSFIIVSLLFASSFTDTVWALFVELSSFRFLGPIIPIFLTTGRFLGEMSLLSFLITGVGLSSDSSNDSSVSCFICIGSFEVSAAKVLEKIQALLSLIDFSMLSHTLSYQFSLEFCSFFYHIHIGILCFDCDSTIFYHIYVNIWHPLYCFSCTF